MYYNQAGKHDRDRAFLSIRFKLLIIASILGIAIGVYWNSLENEFVNWDDDKLIVQNSYIRTLNSQNVKAMFTPGTLASYQPIRTLSYAIDYHFWKLDPKGYHLGNIFLNTCNTLLVYLIAFALTKNFILACVASVLFAVHPAHVEAVTWLSGRRDVLSLAFALFAFYCFLQFKRYDTEQSGQRTMYRACFYAVSFLSFTLGLLTKPSLVIFPGLLVLYDCCFTPRFYRKLQNLFVYIPFFLVTIGFLRIFLSVARAAGVAKAAYHGDGGYATLLIMLRVFGEYILMLLLPKNFSVAYGVQPVMSMTEGAFLLAAVILLAVVILSIWAWTKARIIFFGVCWFFIGLAPVSNIIPISVVKADRYLYLPSVGYCVAVAALIIGCWNILKQTGTSQRGKKILIFGYWMLIAGIIYSHAAMTILRNRDWKNSITLWAATLDVYPEHPIALNNLGLIYAEQGQYDKALILFKKILNNTVYFEGLHGVLTNIGHAYAEKQMFEQAIEFYQRAININPSSIAAYNGLGLCYIYKGELEKGRQVYRQALRIAPESEILKNGLGKFIPKLN